jgi:hypothetical protein
MLQRQGLLAPDERIISLITGIRRR